MKFDKNDIKKWVIYKIVNPIGQIYIGCTCRFNSRMSRYKYLKCENQILLYNSLKEYGIKSHSIAIIDTFVSNHDYSKGKEIFWIRTYMSNVNQFPEINGLNKSMGGGIAHHLQSKESRLKAKLTFIENPNILIERGKKISFSMRGKKHSKDRVNKNIVSSILKRGKPILQLDLCGNIVKEFPSISTAVKELSINKGDIWRILKGHKEKHKNMVFKYKL